MVTTFYYYVSQFTVETYCCADGRCLLKQPRSVVYHWNQCDKEILKKCRAVRPSVCPFVYNAHKNAYSSIIDSRIIICISDERVYHPLQENGKLSRLRAQVYSVLLKKLKGPPLINSWHVCTERYSGMVYPTSNLYILFFCPIVY